MYKSGNDYLLHQIRNKSKHPIVLAMQKYKKNFHSFTRQPLWGVIASSCNIIYSGNPVVNVTNTGSGLVRKNKNSDKLYFFLSLLFEMLFFEMIFYDKNQESD